MGRSIHPPGQADLLEWQAPDPVVRFEEASVRSATVNGRIARAISTALVGRDRAAVAQAMGHFLGRPVSKAMVDAYASAARSDHAISMQRFMALVHVTGDRRLLELLAEPMQWAVIERRFLPLIELAAVQERQDELRRQGDSLRRAAKSSGVLR